MGGFSRQILTPSTTLTGRRIGAYQVVLTNGQDTIVAYTTLRARPCRQVAHTYACGNAPASPVPNAASVGLSSLAPGDTIRTGDFDVIVTEVEGGGSGTWTGVGYTEIPYLKGSRIAVEFKGASINDCYEFTGQSGTVQSAYDPSWGGVTSVDAPLDQTRNALQQIADLLNNYKASDKAALQQLSGQMNTYVQAINSDTTLTSGQKQQLIGAINSTKESVDCFVSSSGGRRSADSTSCTLDEAKQAANVSYATAAHAEDKDCPCGKPERKGTEGEKYICNASIRMTFGMSGPVNIPCNKTWIYFESMPNSGYKPDWYWIGDYNDIAKLVDKKIGPVIFIHGTFSDPTAFTEDFKEKLISATKWNISLSNTASIQWNGSNNTKSRQESAEEISKLLNSQYGRKKLSDLKKPLHVLLVAHSHGGNVAKLIKNKLESVSDVVWQVDVINIETPQRSDIQSMNSYGKYLSFWSPFDVVQWAGARFDWSIDNFTPGPLGSRQDPKAVNVELLSRGFLNDMLPNSSYYVLYDGLNLKKWMNNSMGHSLQNDEWYQQQILYHIQRNFKK